MISKGFLTGKAFEELALAGYEFDITPEETQSMASTMEMTVAGWLPDGIRLPFNFSADPSSVDVDADSGLPMIYARTVWLAAAIAVAASFGKSLRAEQVKAFNEGYSRLLRTAAFPPEQQLQSTFPKGAGNKPWRFSQNPFFPPPDTGPLQPAEDGGLTIGS